MPCSIDENQKATTMEYNEIFEKVVLPVFSQEFPDQHYTYDMFTNLVRPAESQDGRISEKYWKIKSSVGGECFAMWRDIRDTYARDGICLRGKVDMLVQRLKKWYNEESHSGLTRNPNSSGSNSPLKKVFDLDWLDANCPNIGMSGKAYKWTTEECRGLWAIAESDNAFVAMKKRRFRDYYDKKDAQNLRLWMSENLFFYKNLDKITRFLKANGLNAEDRTLVCSLLKFSDKHNPSTRADFESFIANA